MSQEGYRSTTVHFPRSILQGLKMYIAKHDLDFHDQSKVAAIALKKFLEADGIPINDLDETMIDFEILLASTNTE